jgi:hypothetical protein
MSGLRRNVPSLIGNLGIVLSLAWIAPSHPGLGRLILVGLMSALLFNGSVFAARRFFGSRTRAGANAISVWPRHLNPVHKAIPVVLAALGCAICVIGVLVPFRLPRDERNIDSQTIYGVISSGFICVAGYLDRKQRR